MKKDLIENKKKHYLKKKHINYYIRFFSKCLLIVFREEKIKNPTIFVFKKQKDEKKTKRKDDTIQVIRRQIQKSKQCKQINAKMNSQLEIDRSIDV